MVDYLLWYLLMVSVGKCEYLVMFRLFFSIKCFPPTETANP